MDLRKINSYMILLAIVVVVGLFVSTVARLVILAKGVDAGTANLVFLIMLGTCAIAYLTILAAFSSIADFIADKILPKIARKKALTAEATRIPPIDDIPDSDVEQIKQEADKRFLERQKEQIELFRRYGHREVGPYTLPMNLCVSIATSNIMHAGIRLDRTYSYSSAKVEKPIYSISDGTWHTISDDRNRR